MIVWTQFLNKSLPIPASVPLPLIQLGIAVTLVIFWFSSFVATADALRVLCDKPGVKCDTDDESYQAATAAIVFSFFLVVIWAFTLFRWFKEYKGSVAAPTKPASSAPAAAPAAAPTYQASQPATEQPGGHPPVEHI